MITLEFDSILYKLLSNINFIFLLSFSSIFFSWIITSESKKASEFIVVRGSLDVVGSFDTLGVYTNRPIVLNDLVEGEAYFLSIAAKNSLGTSEPTEMLGVVPSSNPVDFLIVNGFDRVSGTSNPFDFIRQHGSALHSNGKTFDSASNEAIIEEDVNIMNY